MRDMLRVLTILASRVKANESSSPRLLRFQAALGIVGKGVEIPFDGIASFELIVLATTFGSRSAMKATKEPIKAEIAIIDTANKPDTTTNSQSARPSEEYMTILPSTHIKIKNGQL